MFAGGPAPLLATWLLHATGTPYSISVDLVLASMVPVLCAWSIADRSRADIAGDATYARRA